ncbi:thiamine pyrophosphate-binding protein [Pseudomonas aeruginosa]|uniref:thiamine pyrophosphate-binding protein n=1 Tax=Pseudomonas aeruginosa TaxID=287 RepID=UPI001D109E3A|nr:thiamine pyrophosphate-binding protein [Pseudomonas aeruginosa]
MAAPPGDCAHAGPVPWAGRRCRQFSRFRRRHRRSIALNPRPRRQSSLVRPQTRPGGENVQHGCRSIARTLEPVGVKRVFGYPGDGINGSWAPWPARRGIRLYPRAPRGDGGLHGRPRQVHRRGRVCLATSGPGAIHLLNGLYDARMDHQPVLAIVGQQAATALGSDYQQEVDLQSLFKDVSAYVETVVSRHNCSMCWTEPARGGRRAAGGDGDRAQRRATGPEAPAPRARPRDVGGGFVQPRPYARDADLEAAGRSSIAAGAWRSSPVPGPGAHRQLEAVAERLAAGVAKALLGKAAVSDDLPYVTGSIGLLGTASSMLIRIATPC